MVVVMRGTEDSTDSGPMSSFFEGSEIAEDGRGGVSEELLDRYARDLVKRLLWMQFCEDVQAVLEDGGITAVMRRDRLGRLRLKYRGLGLDVPKGGRRG